MGNQQSQSKQDKELIQELSKQKKKDKHIIKALFLGSGGSGKSTLFKQLRAIHGDGYSREDRLTFNDHIHAQIIEQMKLAAECIELVAEEKLQEQCGDDYKRPNDFDPFDQLSYDGHTSITVLQSIKDPKLNDERAGACKQLWTEVAVKNVYDQRATMKIEDSSAYFWDKIDAICTSGYCPDETDILLVRYRTTGVIDQKFTIKKNTYHFLDVGGQKSERKKWIHCFESLSGVVFVVSLSGFDEVMFEDEGVSTMDDAIQLFENIVNNTWFEKTKIFLLFNKKDLFAEKIQHKSLEGCGNFADGYDVNIYWNECDEKYEKNFEYIKERFVERIENDKKDDVHIFKLCASDQNNVEKQFNTILPLMVDPNMESETEIIVDTMNETSPPLTDELNAPKPNITKQSPNIKRKVPNIKDNDDMKDAKISRGEKALRMVGKLVYFIVMLVYGLHVMLLYPFLHLFCRRKLNNSSWLFEKIPIEDSFYGMSILLTTTIVLVILFASDVYSEIQSWMIAYIIWCIYVVIYLFNRACTVYAIFSDREICGMKAGNVKALNLIIKYVVGVEVENKSENNYTRLLAVIGGLFPALLAGLIANYILQEKYRLKCSQDIVSEMCDGPICCKVISSHEFGYFYEFIGTVASRIIAAFGIVRIIGWLFCKGHPELRDIAQKINKHS